MMEAQLEDITNKYNLQVANDYEQAGKRDISSKNSSTVLKKGSAMLRGKQGYPGQNSQSFEAAYQQLAH